MAIKTNKIFRRKSFWAGLLLAQFLLFFVLPKVPTAVYKFENFFEFQKGLHQKLFSFLPFSVGDVFYVLLGIVTVFLIIKIINKKSRNSGLIKFLVLLNVLYFTYQIFWGMLYFQKPLIEKLPQKEPDVEAMKALALKYLEQCKQTRYLVDEDRYGVFKVYRKKALKSEILKQQAVLPQFINDKKAGVINSFKPSLFKGVMSYTGILGYYNPFTAEANYNSELPSTYLPFTLAHESAHQLGYAREQEANFIGYLIGKNSTNDELRYSTEYFVLKSLLNAIASEDEKFVKSIINQYSEEMKRDRFAERMFNRRHAGFLDAFFGFTNDLFLKSNQQEGSVTYSYFVDLLLRYESSAQ